MTIATFNPSVAPDSGLDPTTKIRILVNDFGDGYTQRSGDGLNTVAETVPLKWSLISGTVAAELYDFFIAQAGYKAFYYTIPNDTVQKKWICVDFGRPVLDGGNYSFRATIRQVFDLG